MMILLGIVIGVAVSFVALCYWLRDFPGVT